MWFELQKQVKDIFSEAGFMSCQYLLQCLSLWQWFFTCSVYSKRQCCHVFSSWASHLPERRSEADESILLPHHLHSHQPMAQPRQQNTRAPAPVGSLPDTSHTDQRSGHIWTLRSVSNGRECERGLSSILPCGLVRGINTDFLLLIQAMSRSVTS